MQAFFEIFLRNFKKGLKMAKLRDKLIFGKEEMRN